MSHTFKLSVKLIYEGPNS